MLREYTLTSPDLLYPQHPPRSPQPPPHLHPAPSFQSPSHQREDHLNQKYPTSSKYNPLRQLSKSPPVQRHTSMSPIQQTPFYSHTGDSSQAIEISQLRLTVSQLRSSLQTCSQSSQRLQEELFQEKSKNMELNEVRRRMEEELVRMEFQLDRIGNYDSLESRQATIKLENAQRENSRLSQQVSDLLEEIKTIKHDQRALMTQCDTLLKDKQALMGENEGLVKQLQALRGLEREMKEVKHEMAMHSQENLQIQHNIPSRINNLHTVRTNQASTINNSPRPYPSTHLPIPNIKTKTNPSIHLQDLSEYAEYQREDELQKQILELQEQNKSLKQLYKNFYSAEEKHQDPQAAHMQTFSNKINAQKLQSSRLQHQADDSPTVMLKTMQKRQLSEEVAAVRDTAIGQLVKVFNNAVEKSEKQRNNSFKVFLHYLLKNKLTFFQMAENYLQVRTAIQQETGLKFPQNLDERQVTEEKELKILQIYQSVKEKSRNKKKLEKQNGISLGIFRLLTLLIKASPISANLSDNIKHSLLKYVYKLGNKQRFNSQQS